MQTLLDDLNHAMADGTPARGLGHDFYPYPARMSPAVARYLIQTFSAPGDWLLDPFMGGGTTIIEALAEGRRAAGVDINAVAHLLTLARTTPLSPTDACALRDWAAIPTESAPPYSVQTKWTSIPLGNCLAQLTQAAGKLPSPRRRRFAKAVLLKVGQWALDRRDQPPSEADLHLKLLETVEGLLSAVSELAERSSRFGIPRNQFTAHRRLLHRNAIGIQDDARLAHLKGAINLVVTSPPYPAVHVLYHRWQLQSRRETPAPYWIIDSQDGHGASYYTMGSRSPTGLLRYFESIEEAFRSVRPFLKDGARLCLLLAFRDPAVHSPLFLQALQRAGYEICDYPLVWRQVPNRRWYTKRQTDHSAAREVLLILKPT